MEKIALTRPGMGVLPVGEPALTPFGLLAGAFAQALADRAGIEEGPYPYVPLELLEEGEQPPAAPAKPPVLQLRLQLQLLLNALKKDPAQVERQTAVRIVERILRLSAGEGREGQTRRTEPGRPAYPAQRDRAPGGLSGSGWLASRFYETWSQSAPVWRAPGGMPDLRRERRASGAVPKAGHLAEAAGNGRQYRQDSGRAVRTEAPGGANSGRPAPLFSPLYRLSGRPVVSRKSERVPAAAAAGIRELDRTQWVRQWEVYGALPPDGGESRDRFPAGGAEPRPGTLLFRAGSPAHAAGGAPTAAGPIGLAALRSGPDTAGRLRILRKAPPGPYAKVGALGTGEALPAAAAPDAADWPGSTGQGLTFSSAQAELWLAYLPGEAAADGRTAGDAPAVGTVRRLLDGLWTSLVKTAVTSKGQRRTAETPPAQLRPFGAARAESSRPLEYIGQAGPREAAGRALTGRAEGGGGQTRIPAEKREISLRAGGVRSNPWAGVSFPVSGEEMPLWTPAEREAGEKFFQPTKGARASLVKPVQPGAGAKNLPRVSGERLPGPLSGIDRRAPAETRRRHVDAPSGSPAPGRDREGADVRRDRAAGLPADAPLGAELPFLRPVSTDDLPLNAWERYRWRRELAVEAAPRDVGSNLSLPLPLREAPSPENPEEGFHSLPVELRLPLEGRPQTAPAGGGASAPARRGSPAPAETVSAWTGHARKSGAGEETGFLQAGDSAFLGNSTQREDAPLKERIPHSGRSRSPGVPRPQGRADLKGEPYEKRGLPPADLEIAARTWGIGAFSRAQSVFPNLEFYHEYSQGGSPLDGERADRGLPAEGRPGSLPELRTGEAGRRKAREIPVPSDGERGAPAQYPGRSVPALGERAFPAVPGQENRAAFLALESTAALFRNRELVLTGPGAGGTAHRISGAGGTSRLPITGTAGRGKNSAGEGEGPYPWGAAGAPVTLAPGVRGDSPAADGALWYRSVPLTVAGEGATPPHSGTEGAENRGGLQVRPNVPERPEPLYPPIRAAETKERPIFPARMAAAKAPLFFPEGEAGGENRRIFPERAAGAKDRPPFPQGVAGAKAPLFFPEGEAGGENRHIFPERVAGAGAQLLSPKGTAGAKDRPLFPEAPSGAKDRSLFPEAPAEAKNRSPFPAEEPETLIHRVPPAGEASPPAASKAAPGARMDSEYVRTLPEWAQRFLRSGGEAEETQTPQARLGAARRIGGMPWRKPGEGAPAQMPEEQIEWTAPAYRPAGPLTFREPEEAQAPQPQGVQTLNARDIQRTADQVYRLIEERLRRERRRLGL